MEIYFDSDYMIVKYDPVHHILISTVKVAPSSSEFRDSMMTILAAMQHFKAGRVVCDVVNLGALLEEDQIWAATVWRPLAVKAGHSRAAFVLPDDVFTNMSMEDMMAKADKDVSFGYFNRMEDAVRWLIIPQQMNNRTSDVFESKTDLH